ncbi:dihydrodipicolinate synthase family protein [Ammoniphilus sp. 3BR4]|uniref:dihydrodipicolinate synthase family protein n=1 Tax=Ammoniphilus sp. 3BR4 TaxID=3158265 RepID=UPI0034673871
MKKLYGVTTAMVTPFNQEGQVDVDKLKNLTEFLISKGVHCLYPCGTTGEMLRLSVDERKAIAETVVRTADGRVTVFIHVGAMTQEDTIELAKHAHAIGADGIGVVTPAFFGANDRELEEYFVKVASSVPEDFSVYLYNIPQCATNDLKTDVAQRVANRCKNVVGIKYSFPDFLRTNEYLAIHDGDFSVLPGADRLFLPALAMGCDGVVSGVSSVYPEPFVAVYQAFQENDLPKAREIQRVAIQVCETLKSGSNMSYFKEALKLRGVDAGHMKQPQLDLTPEELSSLKLELEAVERNLKKVLL